MSQLKYLTDDISELDAAEHDLEANGIPRSHIHVLSCDDKALASHDLPPFSEWAKRDIAYYAARGAFFGAAFASMILLAGLLIGTAHAAAWFALSFLALGVMGFCTWEGGLVGVTQLNHKFENYKQEIAQGEHLIVVNVDNEEQERVARYSLDSHPPLRLVE
ncbi:NAD/FAD-utilizing enzyme [Agaribacterium haliotis]|uniref:NAD/FAD-utilizing enzyme n=1 Tax=Agaribacterium haliotis TaxID=2013869 RepID=UPI000BB54D64|nr:NAD/FAD-utilizing enzyme [Agaribacterium haliotis]